MATILVVGSHPVVTRHVTEALRAVGWQAIAAVGPQAGMRAIAQHHVDAMVVGGPTALAERNRLESRLRERNRWAPVVVPEGRTAAEVLASHLHHRNAGELEEDLRANYDEHVVILAASGVHYGHDGVRYLTLLLQEDLPEPRYTWRTALADGEAALVEWEARGADETEEEGVDSYLIRNGRIVARTVSVKSWR